MKNTKRGSSWTARLAAAVLLAGVTLAGCGNHGQGRMLWNAPAPQLTEAGAR